MTIRTFTQYLTTQAHCCKCKDEDGFYSYPFRAFFYKRTSLIY